MKGLLYYLMLILTGPLICGAVFIFGYVLLVVMTIPQTPAWAQPGITGWLFDVPQDSETHDNGLYGDTAPTYSGQVTWEGYAGPEGDIQGLPLWGPLKHWSDTYDKPLLGCVFQDPHYSDHTGADFPVNTGTPVHTTMGGKVVWAEDNGPWGNLVVVENGDYQVWFAHLDRIEVVPGQIVARGTVVGLSGDTGNSSGPHLHYGIKQRTGLDSYVWANPQLYFDAEEVIRIGCSD